jgi:hypothetical protein
MFNRFFALVRAAPLAVVCTTGCADGSTATPLKVEQPIIYGTDDRRDVYDVDDPVLRGLATDSTVALIYTPRLELGDDQTIRWQGQSLQAARQLCPDERFGEQPVVPFCSGVLVDEDLVLTAGHCFRSSERSPEDVCRSTSFVFGFYESAPSKVADITAADVLGCRRLVAYRASESDPQAPDYAFVQLERVAAARTAVNVAHRDGTQLVGEHVHLIGNGAGLPTKIDSGGHISGIYGNAYVVADTDAFEGGSGSGLFDDSLSLLAIQVRGGYDWERGLTCTQAAHGGDAKEQHVLASVAVAALCDSYPSARLCNRPTRCGDGVCGSAESVELCPADCAAPCGDGLCLPEERGTCAADCDFISTVPPDWLCAPWSYSDGTRCDCGCGSVDPDCNLPSAPVNGCGFGESCDARGICVLPPLTGASGTGSGSPLAPRGGSGCALVTGSRDATEFLVLTVLCLLTHRRRIRRRGSVNLRLEIVVRDA